MNNLKQLSTQKFLTQALKQNELGWLMTQIDKLLTLKQFNTIRQNTKQYSALALRAKKVSKNKTVHELADELYRLSKIPVMSTEERERGEAV